MTNVLYEAVQLVLLVALCRWWVPRVSSRRAMRGPVAGPRFVLGTLLLAMWIYRSSGRRREG